MKKVLYAHIEREIMFDSKTELDRYLAGLKEKKKHIIIISLREIDGNHFLRFKERYNATPFFPEDRKEQAAENTWIER